MLVEIADIVTAGPPYRMTEARRKALAGKILELSIEAQDQGAHEVGTAGLRRAIELSPEFLAESGVVYRAIARVCGVSGAECPARSVCCALSYPPKRRVAAFASFRCKDVRATEIGRRRAMYHFFLVHSHITAHVAEEVVRHEGLDGARVVFLTSRHFSPPHERFRLVELPFTFQPESFPRQRNLLDCWRRLHSIDRFVRRLSEGHSFHFYTPQTSQRFMRIILSHRLCRGFSFLEEGLHSYCTRQEIERIHPTQRERFIDKVGYRRRIGDAPFFQEGHSKAYGLSSASFPGFANRVILDDVLTASMQQAPAGVENVIVFDSLSVYDRVQLSSVGFAVRRLMDWLSEQGAESVHYKFHPAQLGTEEVATLEALLAEWAPRTRVQRLAEEISLETLAAANDGICFFVNLSSIGLYASLQGCRAFSIAGWVAEAEPAFAERIAQVPKIFWDSVQDLKKCETPHAGNGA